jgi:hypothetical protein
VKRLAILAGSAAMAASLLGLGGGAAHAAAGPPYVDPRATSSLALCGPDGQQVTSGRIDQKPFVWRAVSTSAAPTPYDEAGRTATLFAYQPRPQVDAAAWSGDLLTASARYTDAGHPMAAATALDEPLRDFLSAYPAKLDGFVQLRLYLGAPQQPAFTLKYAAANIQVTGNTWHLVGRPAAVSCSSGTAVSLEAILPKPAPTAKASTTSGSAGSSPAAATPSAGAAATGSVTSGVAATSADTRLAADDGGQRATLLLVGGLAVVAAGSIAWWWLMRRRARGL